MKVEVINKLIKLNTKSIILPNKGNLKIGTNKPFT